MNRNTSVPRNALEVAVVGGGIAGLTLALGLLSRGVSVIVYERGSNFREIGAGIGFTPNAERAMLALDPRIHEAFKRVTVQNGTDWFNWMDGWREDGDTAIHKMYLGVRGFEGCHRADFLDELIKLMPGDIVQFEKKLDCVLDLDGNRQAELRFTDGTLAHADIVVGCDGIRSTVRKSVLGENSPASYPTYTHKYAFRGLIPMPQAKHVLSTDRIDTRHMYLGHDAHALTFPVAGGKLLNVVAFVSDDNDWPYAEKFTAPASKTEAVHAFANFDRTVRSIIDLLPEQLDKWAVFDSKEYPASSFVKGRVCISGDAAHAAAPYHGAGAGFAVEDAVVLAHLISAAEEVASKGPTDKEDPVRTALETYNAVRIGRAQWLVESSHFVGRMYQWQDGKIGSDHQRCAEEIEWRSRKIWDYDIENMLAQASESFQKRLGGF